MENKSQEFEKFGNVVDYLFYILPLTTNNYTERPPEIALNMIYEYAKEIYLQGITKELERYEQWAAKTQRDTNVTLSKGSSVQWLIDNLTKACALYHNGSMGVERFERVYKEILEKIKPIHFNEIRNAYIKGYEDKDVSYFDPEAYYKDTFETKNNE